MSIKLRDLIRNVRACKTAAEERAVIAKECALIRTSFKDEDATFRHRNVAKLLFIHMLGYPSHFGQMECLKLIASPRFLDKRVGYLGLAILVEESAEVLTLVTNSLSSDLEHRNQFVQGLALAALGNVSNKDMLRDLSNQVLKLLSHSNVYVRKKATLCAVQILKKVPDMVEDFVPVAVQMLQDRNHAVKLTSATLLAQVARAHPGFIKKVRKAVPVLVRTLKELVLSGYAPEYDVNGITDPFLQVQILQLLGLLGKGHAGASEQMNDILAQVATNTEGNRNSGNSILYECVRTILMIDCEDGLRVLAINILGRFLQNRDNNIRYIALYMLNNVVDIDKDAVQRHRDTIVECLRDSDSSIRSRAIELVFALLNRDSIVPLSKEILNYLVVAPEEQKETLCTRLLDATFLFAPNKAWHVHTLISALCIAGSLCRDQVWQSAVALIGQPESESFRAQVAHRLFDALTEDKSQRGLVCVAVWTLGEYGTLVFVPVEKEESTDMYTPRSEDEVLDLLEETRRSHDATTAVKGMVLTAYAKLSVRFQETRPRIHDLLKTYEQSMNADLQARSTEFFAIVESDFDSTLKNEWLAQMPAPTDEELAERRVRAAEAVLGGDDDEDYMLDGGEDDDDSDDDDDDDDDSDDSDDSEDEAAARRAKSKKKGRSAAPAKESSNLLDLDDIFGGGGGSSTAASSTAGAAASSAAAAGQSTDLLADIFGGGGGAPAQPAAAPVPASRSSGGDDLLGVFGSEPTSNGSAGMGESFPSLKAFEKGGISVTMDFARGSGDKEVIVTATYSNSNSEEVSGFVLQSAVPKFISQRMESPSGHSLPAFNSGSVQQRIILVNSMQGAKPIVMKIKITYTMNGQQVVEQATVQGFPPGL
ncbi:AP-1 complex subunit gamma [Hondaea fermentalgiana]|uniref:AP-1 complex subunit gamma n=1 Tax=Hondaea fermentalgiana TaxID=2315210 RepID=A0A2R5G3X0_9STRA|nr:AP-1 complex subunit gamma [Hondaea fermentalgiana]|eukprot:GBG25245.1 AP-1 complex subunit gamma [Hondaea fermentalgiana]